MTNTLFVMLGFKPGKIQWWKQFFYHLSALGSLAKFIEILLNLKEVFEGPFKNVT